MRPHLVATLSAAIALSTMSPVRATGVVELEQVTLDEGNVTTFLEVTSQHFVDAMRALITERYREEYRAIRWEALEEAMRSASIARFEYRFMVNGVLNVRIYHAMGGRSLSTLAKSIFEGQTPVGTPESPMGPIDFESDDALASGALSVADEAALDVADGGFFTSLGEFDIRAPVRARGASIIDAFVVGDRDRLFDPEFKALRAIESDLQSGAVPRGGRIQGSVSELVCSSCERAMTRFADTYGVEMRVAHMYPSTRGAGIDGLVTSGKARLRGSLLVDTASDRPLLATDLLRGAREGQIRRSLSPRAMGRSFKGMPWSRRSFQLNPVRLQRVSEASSEGSPPPRPRVPKDPAEGC